jgi:hypothetical protein
MPVHERNTGDDLFADSDWYSSRRRQGWIIRNAVPWLWSSVRSGHGVADARGRADLFDLDEPLLDLAHSETRSCLPVCSASGSASEDDRWCSRIPTTKVACGGCLLLLVLVALVLGLFSTQLIQLSVDVSDLSFVAVNISLPSLPTALRHRSLQSRSRAAAQGYVVSVGTGLQEASGDSAVIGFDSVVDISTPALLLWPWTARLGGGNFTLAYSLRPGKLAHGDSGGDGDGRFVPCTVGSLYLPPISLRGGRKLVDGLSIVGGLLHVSPASECFQGFTRSVLIADSLFLFLRGATSVQLAVAAGTASWSIGFPAVVIDKTVSISAMGLPASSQRGGASARGDNDGMQVTDISLNTSTSANLIAQIRLVIRNPSALELSPLGDLTFAVAYEDLTLGRFAVQAWGRVTRGDNLVLLHGVLDIAPDQLAHASELFSALLGGRRVSLLTHVASSSNAIVANGLNGVVLNTSVAAPPLPLLAPRGVEILSCFLTPAAMDASRPPERGVGGEQGWGHELADGVGWSYVVLDMRVRIWINALLGNEARMEIVSLAASVVQMVYAGEIVATLALGKQEVPADEQRKLELVLDAAATARVSDAGFGMLVRDFMVQDAIKVSLAVVMSANVTTSIGSLSLRDIALEQSLVLQGAAGFKKVRVLAFDVSGDVGRVMQVWVKAEVRAAVSCLCSGRIHPQAFV